jgi:hypothetical protein
MKFCISTLTCNDRQTLFAVIESTLKNAKFPIGTFWFIVLQGCTQLFFDAVAEKIKSLLKGVKGTNTVIYNNEWCFKLIYIPENLGLSRGMNLVVNYTIQFEYVLFIEDDWYCLAPKITLLPDSWPSICLNYLDSHKNVSTLFLRKYATPQEKEKYGWSRPIFYVNHQHQTNFNWAAKIKDEPEELVDGVPFRRIPEFLFTFNPCIRRNQDYRACGVFPFPEFNDISSRRQEWTATPESHCENWGFAESFSMEKTRHLTTMNVGHGIFGHMEDILPLGYVDLQCSAAVMNGQHI